MSVYQDHKPAGHGRACDNRPYGSFALLDDANQAEALVNQASIGIDIDLDRLGDICEIMDRVYFFQIFVVFVYFDERFR